MYRRVALTLLALLTGFATGTVRTAERKWTPDALLKVKRVTSVVPSPDATRVALWSPKR